MSGSRTSLLTASKNPSCASRLAASRSPSRCQSAVPAAFASAICGESGNAPSMRPSATRSPPSSTTATAIFQPLATAWSCAARDQQLGLCEAQRHCRAKYAAALRAGEPAAALAIDCTTSSSVMTPRRPASIETNETPRCVHASASGSRSGGMPPRSCTLVRILAMNVCTRGRASACRPDRGIRRRIREPLHQPADELRLRLPELALRLQQHLEQLPAMGHLVDRRRPALLHPLPPALDAREEELDLRGEMPVEDRLADPRLGRDLRRRRPPVAAFREDPGAVSSSADDARPRADGAHDRASRRRGPRWPGGSGVLPHPRSVTGTPGRLGSWCERIEAVATIAPTSAISAARPAARRGSPSRNASVVRRPPASCGDDRAHDGDPERAADLPARVQHGRADARPCRPAPRSSPPRSSASSSAPCRRRRCSSPGRSAQKLASAPSARSRRA